MSPLAISIRFLQTQPDDRLLGQNRDFAAALGRLDIPHRFLVRRGGHNWALWRGNAAVALLAAGRRLA